jgi:hypothetical protein
VGAKPPLPGGVPSADVRLSSLSRMDILDTPGGGSLQLDCSQVRASTASLSHRMMS